MVFVFAFPSREMAGMGVDLQGEGREGGFLVGGFGWHVVLCTRTEREKSNRMLGVLTCWSEQDQGAPHCRSDNRADRGTIRVLLPL